MKTGRSIGSRRQIRFRQSMTENCLFRLSCEACINSGFHPAVTISLLRGTCCGVILSNHHQWSRTPICDSTSTLLQKQEILLNLLIQQCTSSSFRLFQKIFQAALFEYLRIQDLLALSTALLDAVLLHPAAILLRESVQLSHVGCRRRLASDCMF